MVIAVYDSSDDCDDNDDDGDVFEDTSRKRAFPDKMDYSSSSRKREKLDWEEDNSRNIAKRKV